MKFWELCVKTIFVNILLSSICLAKTSLKPSISVGSMYQGGVFQGVNQGSGGGSFEAKRNPYGAPAYLGALQIGISQTAAQFYLAANIYYTFNTFHKTIYHNATTSLVEDKVQLKTKGGIGASLHIGIQTKSVIPYISIGVEYTKRALTYKATNLANDLHKNHRKPVFIFGLGMMGEIYKKFSMGFEIQRKVGQEFDVQIPISAGYPSLANHRIKVGTSHWAAVINFSYAFDILKK